MQLPLCLSPQVMEGRVKILETYPKPEGIISFYQIFTVFIVITLSRIAMFVMTLSNLNLACQHISWKASLKLLETNCKFEEITQVCPVIEHLGTSIMISLTGNVHV